MKDKIKAGLFVLASLAGAYWMIKTSKPIDSNQPIGLPSIIKIINCYHDGVEKNCNDQDFDKDGMNDWYVKAKDGTIYYTQSHNLVKGIDNTEVRTWYKK